MDPRERFVENRKAMGSFMGPPELVVEVSDSNVSIDLNEKLEAYRKAAVLSTLPADVGTRAEMAVFEGRRVSRVAGGRGRAFSAAGFFPGLWWMRKRCWQVMARA